MISALLIREARRRAGLTQCELGERLRITQPQIARWESGRVLPSLERVKEVLRACGLDLVVALEVRDEDTRRMLAAQATRSRDELIDAMVALNEMSEQRVARTAEHP